MVDCDGDGDVDKVEVETSESAGEGMFVTEMRGEDVAIKVRVSRGVGVIEHDEVNVF